jgi:Arc/MetJ-type ribon-helix-helix transcriptional regulator
MEEVTVSTDLYEKTRLFVERGEGREYMDADSVIREALRQFLREHRKTGASPGTTEPRRL